MLSCRELFKDVLTTKEVTEEFVAKLEAAVEYVQKSEEMTLDSTKCKELAYDGMRLRVSLLLDRWREIDCEGKSIESSQTVISSGRVKPGQMRRKKDIPILRNWTYITCLVDCPAWLGLSKRMRIHPAKSCQAPPLCAPQVISTATDMYHILKNLLIAQMTLEGVADIQKIPLQDLVQLVQGILKEFARLVLFKCSPEDFRGAVNPNWATNAAVSNQQALFIRREIEEEKVREESGIALHHLEECRRIREQTRRNRLRELKKKKEEGWDLQEEDEKTHLPAETRLAQAQQALQEEDMKRLENSAPEVVQEMKDEATRTQVATVRAWASKYQVLQEQADEGEGVFKEEGTASSREPFIKSMEPLLDNALIILADRSLPKKPMDELVELKDSLRELRVRVRDIAIDIGLKVERGTFIRAAKKWIQKTLTPWSVRRTHKSEVGSTLTQKVDDIHIYFRGEPRLPGFMEETLTVEGLILQGMYRDLGMAFSFSYAMEQAHPSMRSNRTMWLWDYQEECMAISRTAIKSPTLVRSLSGLWGVLVSWEKKVLWFCRFENAAAVWWDLVNKLTKGYIYERLPGRLRFQI